MPGCGASGVGRSPDPDRLSFGAYSRGPLPTGCGCGGCGCGDPSPIPQRAGFCACLARCGGGKRVPGGGASLASVWGVRNRALSHPRPPVLWGVRPGPTTHWLWVRGVRARGLLSSPTTRAGFARCGGGTRAPGGGASCLGVGRLGSGALPPPAARPLGRVAPTTHWLWVPGAVGVGTRHQSHNARSGVLALRAVRAARGRQGGAPLAWAWGVRGRALCQPRPPHLWGVQPGPTTHWLWVRGVRAWGPVTNPTARTLVCSLGALWGQHEGASGGRLLPGCGTSGVGRSSTPDRPSFGACGRDLLPTGCGCGGCGHGDPSPIPQRALWRAGFARCWGGSRAPGGGAFCLGVGRPGSGALPTPTARPLGRTAGAHYPLAVGAGGAGVGTCHQSHSAHPCVLTWRAVGAARGCPGGGASLASVWGVRGRALPHPKPPVLWGVRPGPTTHWLWVRGVRAWGPVASPTTRALASWLCALWGRHEGAREGRLLPGCGASGVGRSPTPGRPSFGACGPHYPLAVGAGGCGCGDPSPIPQRALWRAGFARCGRGTRAPGGGASCLGMGRPGSGAFPTPTARPLGRAAGAHYPVAVGAGGAGGGTRHQPHSARSCELPLRAVGAARGRPGGGASCLSVRRPGSGAPSTPTAHPLGRAAKAHYQLAVGAGGCRLGDQSPTPQRALLRADLARCGGSTRVPGGGGGVPLAWVWGVRGQALSHPRPPVLTGVRPGPTTHWPWVRGARAWGPVTNPIARALASRLCALWVGARGCPGGGRLLPRCWASGIGRSSIPDRRSFGACGRGPLPTGCGCEGCGRGDPSPTPQRALASWLCAL